MSGGRGAIGALKPLYKTETMNTGHAHMSKRLERHITECKVQYKLGVIVQEECINIQPLNCNEANALGQDANIRGNYVIVEARVVGRTLLLSVK